MSRIVLVMWQWTTSHIASPQTSCRHVFLKWSSVTVSNCADTFWYMGTFTMLGHVGNSVECLQMVTNVTYLIWEVWPDRATSGKIPSITQWLILNLEILQSDAIPWKPGEKKVIMFVIANTWPYFKVKHIHYMFVVRRPEVIYSIRQNLSFPS